MERNSCKVCSTDSQEFKVMLICLTRRLHRLSPDYHPDFREQDLAKTEGFSRLMSCVFGEGNTSSSHCGHQRISSYLRRKLKCDQQTFGQLCSRLLEKVAERNYHLQVLQQQIRSAGKSAISLEERKEKQPEKGYLGPSLHTIGSQSAIGPPAWQQQPRNSAFPMVFLGSQQYFPLLYPTQQPGQDLGSPQKPSEE